MCHLLLMLLLAVPQDPSTLEQAVKEIEAGGEPVELLEKAVGEFEAALDKDPARVDAFVGRGQSRLWWGRILGRRGEDPGKIFQSALVDFQRAAELDPASIAALAGRGDVRTAMVSERRLRAEDVKSSDLDLAVADFAAAIKLDPMSAPSYLGRGLARQQLGLLRFQSTRAFDTMYASALADFDKAVELAPKWAYLRFLRGEARYLHAVHLGYRREDVRPAYRAAAEDYREAEKVNPATLPMFKEHLKIAEVNSSPDAPKSGVKPDRHIVWSRNWELARQESKARNVPIMIYVSGGAG